MPISQKLIELMGGTLELESTVGEGSRFSFTIPLPPAVAEVLASANGQYAQVIRLADGHTVKAIVADDVLKTAKSSANSLPTSA